MFKKTYVEINMDRKERLSHFIARMLDAAACGSFEEAFDLLTATLLAVEDELSGITFDASYPRDDGRMYPPKGDARRLVPGRPDLQRFRSVGHNTYFSDTGAILIADLSGDVLLDKPDSNHRRIIL